MFKSRGKIFLGRGATGKRNIRQKKLLMHLGDWQEINLVGVL